MTIGQSGSVLRSVQTLFDGGTTGGLTDAQLLERFLSRRQETAGAAFEALVVRHGPMVFDICRNVLGDPHDAQDAFQATFLVLARRAGSVRRRDSLASWLFGVARRVASRAKANAARRRTHERKVAESTAEGRERDGEPQDFATLHEEVGRLPEKYRVPVVLCYLQGMTYEAAADSLRCPVGTLSVRLKRARERLRSRLTRRGLAVPAGLAVAGVTANTTRAAVSPALVGLAVRAATGFTVNGAAVAGVVPASVALLAGRTISAMRFKAIGAGLLCGGMVALVATASVGLTRGLRAHGTPERQEGKKEARPWVKSLPGGVTVELVGVSPSPAGPGTWWVPDGSPLPEPPYSQGGARVNPDKSQQAREFAVRVTHPPGKDISYQWQVPYEGGSASGTPQNAGGKVLPDLRMIAVTLPEGRRTCTVRFGVASGQWKTYFTGAPEGGSAQGRERLSVIFGKSHEERGKTSVTVSHEESEDDVRVVAVDRGGKEHAPIGVRAMGVKGFRQLDVEYDLPLAQVQEFRVQSRPFAWAVFEGVALKPRHD